MNEKPIGSSYATGREGWTSPQRDKAKEGTDAKAGTEPRDTMRELAEGVKHTASDLAGQARHAAESRVSVGKDQAIDRLGAVANAVRKTGEHLREAGDGSFTDYFDRAASQVDNAASYLRRKSVAEVMGDVESFARSEPALFLGAAFAAGLLGGRFLKSSKTPATSGARGAGAGAESKSPGAT
ncbi:MAG TPA: hypothetical protein VK841_19455 [Polyangiaceae bacterium]|jgi:hypothetical protein|nr:hypothetical protein [Polyangiaceae bacterium]